MTYRSEQTNGEMILAIGSCIEQQLLNDVVNSPYFSMKQPIFWYISNYAYVYNTLTVTLEVLLVKFLKLLEMAQGTADVICEAVIDYLHVSVKAPVVSDLQKMAGGATDGSSVWLGHSQELRKLFPNLFLRIALPIDSLLLPVMLLTQYLKQRILNQVYVFFSHSTTRTAQLK